MHSILPDEKHNFYILNLKWRLFVPIVHGIDYSIIEDSRSYKKEESAYTKDMDFTNIYLTECSENELESLNDMSEDLLKNFKIYLENNYFFWGIDMNSEEKIKIKCYMEDKDLKNLAKSNLSIKLKKFDLLEYEPEKYFCVKDIYTLKKTSSVERENLYVIPEPFSDKPLLLENLIFKD